MLVTSGQNQSNLAFVTHNVWSNLSILSNLRRKKEIKRITRVITIRRNNTAIDVRN